MSIKTASVVTAVGLVFRELPSAESPVAGLGELVVRAREVGHGCARRLAVLAVKGGVDAFVRGQGPVQRIVIQADPTLDDMLAATFLARLVVGQPLPAGAEGFAVYAALVREGLRPSKIPLEVSLEGIYLALRNFAEPDLTRPEAGASFAADWARMATRILEAAGSSVDPFTTPLFANGPEFARERSFLADDQRVYRQDVLQGERWLVSIPGGPAQASGLLLRRPRSIHWKHWSRSDSEAPIGGSYLFLAVIEQDRHWRFSTDPVHKLSIAALARALQKEEVRCAATGAAADPWFDGKPFGYTLVAAPRRGTALSDKDVLRLVKRWAGARVVSSRGHGGPVIARPGVFVTRVIAAAALLGAVGLGGYFLKTKGGRPQAAPLKVEATANGARSLVLLTDPLDAVVSKAELTVSVRPGPNEFIFRVSRAATLPVRVWADVRPEQPLEYRNLTLRINNDDEKPAPLTPSADSTPPPEPVKAIFRSEEPNWVAVRLDSPAHESRPAKVRLYWQVDLSTPRSLYLLAVGISVYKHPPLRLKYGDVDARAIVQAFKEQEGENKLWRKVVIDPALQEGALTNEGAVKKNLLDRLKWLRENALPGGLAVITLSGHGLKAENDRYFFVTQDYEPGEEPAARCMAWEDFAQYLKGMRCPVVVVLDTCHSGAVRVEGFRGEDPGADVPAAIEEAMQTFARSKDGIVVLSACLPNQGAMERDDWKHGALMLSLLEGLSGRRLFTGKTATPLPHNPRGPVLTLEDLRRYADDRVKELIVQGQTVVLKPSEGLYPGHIPIALGPPSSEHR